MSEPNELRDALESVALIEKHAEAAYLAARRDGGLNRILLVEYRCPMRERCLLLHAWQSPAGILFWKPRYKLEATRNAEQSSEEGRTRNTTDGNNHWKGDGGLLDQTRGWPDHRIQMNCDHLSVWLLSSRILEDADAATPGHPKKRRIPKNTGALQQLPESF